LARVLSDALTGQPDCVWYCGCHRRHIASPDQTPGLRRNEFGNTATVECDDRGAARHRLGDHQSVRLVPERSDESCRRSPDQTGQRVLAQVSGVSSIAAQ
jgi:hypothetical protein